MFGLYPYSVVTKKQKKAMKEAGIDFKYNSIYDLSYKGILLMLNKGGNKNE